MRIEKYVIDRIEDGRVILMGAENDFVMEVSKELYFVEVSDGDVACVFFDDDGKIFDIKIDKAETKCRKKEMKKKIRSLFDN